MRSFFGFSDDFDRELPSSHWRADILLALLLWVLSVTSLVALSSLPPAQDQDLNQPANLTAITTAAILLLLRRRFPVATVLLLTGVHFVTTGILLPFVVLLPSMQVIYFLGLYSAMAWARNREALLVAVFAVLVAMTVWIVVDAAMGVAAIPPDKGNATMLILNGVLINLAYFGGAMYLGRDAWLRAKTVAELASSQSLIAEQAAGLADKAVLGERLRIARELHDSMAHHVSLIGLQTGAARRILDTQPERAREAMAAIEQSSREAVEELRTVVGTLREGPDFEVVSTAAAIPALVAQHREHGLAISYEVVSDADDLTALSPMHISALYRVLQEALTNVRRHSTAKQVRVTIRLLPQAWEAEIVDDGLPRPNGDGSGLGHLGIRERVAALGGTADIGPRAEQGYRVLVRVPRGQRP